MDTATAQPKPDDHIPVAADFIGERDFVEAEMAADPHEGGWTLLTYQFLHLIGHR